MGLLETAAAFAVAMILFATMVTGIVEALVRLVALRALVLEQALLNFAREELTRLGVASGPEPRHRHDVDAAKDDGAAGLVAALVYNPASDEEPGRVPTSGTRQPFAWAARCRRRHRQIDKLSTYAFVQRFAKTELGRDLAEAGEDYLRSRLVDLVRTFERYTAASAEVFRKRIQTITLVVAILFAFAANIDAVRVFRALQENTAARATLLAEAELAAAANAAARARLELRLDQATGGEVPDLDSETVASLGNTTEELTKEVQALRSSGELPIGWRYFPYAQADATDGDVAWEVTREHLRWLAGVLLGGVLIGLGGPFWLRVFTGLSNLLVTLKPFGGGNPEIVTERPDERPATRDALDRREIVDVFKIAAGKVVAPQTPSSLPSAND